MLINRVIHFYFALLLSLVSSSVIAIGPYNYYVDPDNYISNVESNHLSVGVINLEKSVTGSIWGDLDYTLRVYPNHPIALNSMAKLFREKEKYGGNYSKLKKYELYSGMDIERSSAEYYLERASKFAPDDATVQLIYGVHLHKQNKLNEALEKFKNAEKLQPENVDLQYNLGLMYFKLAHYEEARKYAKLAYEKGYPLQGLKNKLVKAGQWDNN